MPNQNDYVVDPVLTEFSIAYSNPELIGTKLFPIVDINSRTGIYYTFDKSKFRIEDTLRSGVSRANRVDYGLTKANINSLNERSLEEAIPWDERDQYPTPLDAYTDATENLTERIDLGLEKEIATICTDTAQLTQNTTLSGTDQWSDLNNSDPFDDIETGLATIQAAIMRPANTAGMGKQVWDKLKHHPDLLGRLSVSSVRVLTTELFGALIGVDNVYIGAAMENTAKEGQTDSMSYVWGKHFVLAYVTPRPQRKTITLGFVFRWAGKRFVDRWSERAVKSDFVRVSDYYDPYLVAAAAGYLIKNAVA